MNRAKAVRKAGIFNAICKNPDLEYRPMGNDDRSHCIVGQFYRGEFVGVAAY